MNDIVVNWKDYILRKSDVTLLDAPNWLNDSLIDFLIALYVTEKIPDQMSSSILALNCTLVQLLKQVNAEEASVILPQEIQMASLIIMPINDNAGSSVGGSHWSLLVYVKEESTFYYLDSMQDSNLNEAKKVLNIVKCVLPSDGRTQFKYLTAAQQQNGFDCGVFVVMFAETMIDLWLNKKSFETIEHTTMNPMKKREEAKYQIEHFTANSN